MNFIFDPSLLLCLPLYEMDGPSFISKDAYGHIFTANGALWTPSGRSFDGTDDYLSNPTLLDVMPEALTLEAWISIQGGSGTWRGIVEKENIVGDDRLRLVIDSSNNITFFVEGQADGGVTVTGLSNSALNKWYHCAGVYEAGAALKIYIDTMMTQSGTTGTIQNGSYGDFIIGNESHATLLRHDFNGLIGEVRVYTRVLSAHEIQHNFLATKWRYR